MEITDDVKSAIWAYLVNEESSTYALGSEIGVAHTTISRWIHGDTRSIRNAIWARLHPLIQPYLEAEDRDRWINEKPAVYRTSRKNTTPAPSPTRSTRVPVISITKAATYCPAVETWETFLAEHGDTDTMDDVEAGCMLFRWEGSPDTPLLSPGAILYADTRTFPKQGELVIAQLSNQPAPVVKYYDRTGSVVHLETTNEDNTGESFDVDLTNPTAGRIMWMYTIVDIRTKPPTKRRTS